MSLVSKSLLLLLLLSLLFDIGEMRVRKKAGLFDTKYEPTEDDIQGIDYTTFKTFRQSAAKELGLNPKLLDTDELQSYYDSRTDISVTSMTSLASMFCALCQQKNVADCINRFCTNTNA